MAQDEGISFAVKMGGAALALGAVVYFTLAFIDGWRGWFGSYPLNMLMGTLFIVGLFPLFPERK